MEERRHSTDLIFVLLVFAAFVITALMVIAMGTGEYRRIVARSQENDDIRIATAYITQKVRQGRSAGAVGTGELDGIPALTVREERGGREFVTYLYVCEGYLRELMTAAGNEIHVIPRSGTAILPMDSLEFEEIGAADVPAGAAAEGAVGAAETTAEGSEGVAAEGAAGATGATAEGAAGGTAGTPAALRIAVATPDGETNTFVVTTAP